MTPLIPLMSLQNKMTVTSTPRKTAEATLTYQGLLRPFLSVSLNRNCVHTTQVFTLLLQDLKLA